VRVVLEPRQWRTKESLSPAPQAMSAD